MFDPQVHIHKTVLMQRLLDAVSRGYHFHVAGTIPLPKAQRLADKFSERYAVHRNECQRAYARSKGRANARLFLLAVPGSTDLLWWLCATSGVGSIHDEETLRDSREQRTRLRIETDYEAVRMTRRQNRGGGAVWTWRMTNECSTRWRVRILLACRGPGVAEIGPSIRSLYRTPGFSGIRQQVGELMVLARREWRHRHGSLDHFPVPLALPYVERLPDTSIRLSELINNRASDVSC